MATCYYCDVEIETGYHCDSCEEYAKAEEAQDEFDRREEEEEQLREEKEQRELWAEEDAQDERMGMFIIVPEREVTMESFLLMFGWAVHGIPMYDHKDSSKVPF